MKQVPKEEPVVPKPAPAPEKSGEDKPLSAKERNNLLTIIAALARHEGPVDLGQPGAAERLEGIIKELERVDGKTSSLDKRALHDKIVQIKELSDQRAWKHPPWKDPPKTKPE